MIFFDLLILICAAQSFLLVFLYVELRAAKESLLGTRPLVKDLVELCHSLAELASRSGQSESSDEPDELPEEDPS